MEMQIQRTDISNMSPIVDDNLSIHQKTKNNDAVVMDGYQCSPKPVKCDIETEDEMEGSTKACPFAQESSVSSEEEDEFTDNLTQLEEGTNGFQMDMSGGSIEGLNDSIYTPLGPPSRRMSMRRGRSRQTLLLRKESTPFIPEEKETNEEGASSDKQLSIRRDRKSIFLKPIKEQQNLLAITKEADSSDRYEAKNNNDDEGRRRMSRAMSFMGGRLSSISDNADWQEFLLHARTEEGNLLLDESRRSHGGHGTSSSSSRILPWYCKPVQRQFWNDEKQALPHINWGDLFFDLFYVAATYNLGVLLISSMNGNNWSRGCVYFVGIFGSLFSTWENALAYASRYAVVDNAHRIFDAVRFVLVASVVLHIKTLDKLSDPKSLETLALMTSLFLESVMQLLLNLEVAFYAEGDRETIYKHSMRKIKYRLIPGTLVYVLAATVAGLGYFGVFDDEEHRSLAPSGGDYSSTSDGWIIADIPYFLALCSLAYIEN